jgi:hypothetical protein
MKNKIGRWKRRKKGRKWAKNKNRRGKKGAKRLCCCAKNKTVVKVSVLKIY